jgi:hypothetical protein
MNIETLCRCIRDDDDNLEEVELADYNAHNVERVLQALRESSCSNLAVEKLVLRHCQLTVKSFTTLLLHFCQRFYDREKNRNSTLSRSSSLTILSLVLHEDGVNDVPSDEIAFRLFRGIATDKPPGLADLLTLKLSIPCLSERSMGALQRLLRKPSTKLIYLDLTNEDEWVDDDAVEKICDSLTCNAASTRLQVLQLDGNDIGNVGAQSLARMLKTNSMLSLLHLASNDIGDDGAVAFADALTSHNKTLLLLDLETNQIGDRGLIALAKALTVNSTFGHLVVKKNPRVTHVGERFLVESVAKMRGLRNLMFGPLQRMANLKRLAASFESNHSVCHTVNAFSENALFNHEEGLEEFPEHLRPSMARKAVLLRKRDWMENYAELGISELKMDFIVKYMPYIEFMCKMNHHLRPLLFQPEDQAPIGLWPLVMKGKRLSIDEMFCVLRDRPGLVCY